MEQKPESGSGLQSEVFMDKIEAKVDEPDWKELEESRVLLIRHATTHFNELH